MKRILLISCILLIIAIILFLIRTITYCDNCKAEIKKRYSYDKTSSMESYKDDCIEEINRSIEFPIDKPAFSRLHFDKFTKPSIALDVKQTDSILGLLNDSASYIWGEIGTPHFDAYITFHDKDGKCIGYTDISFEGQTYSTPSLARMKWGLLTESARTTLLTMINSYSSK